ncbi:MAG: CdaR family protein [Oligoflexia bacterium]|nr:CdaR family protein [Oligoflexia bacterium]
MEKFWHMVLTNIGTKLVSIAIAVVLWFVVLGSRNVEVTKDIPLELITPADIIPANEIPEKITFRLSGPKAFLRAVLDRREDPIRVNLAGAKPGLVTYRFFSDNIRLPIGVKVLSINPTAILIKLEYLKRRDVPVRAVLRGAPPEGYRVARAVLKPDTVKIKGPESRVDGITELQTVPVDVTGMKQSQEKDVSLDLSRNNIQVEGELPRLFLDVEALSPNFRIKNVDIRVLTSYKARLEEKSVTVLVRADPENLRGLDRSRVYAVVDLTGRRKGRYLEPVRVTLPENVGLVKVVPDKVNVTLY